MSKGVGDREEDRRRLSVQGIYRLEWTSKWFVKRELKLWWKTIRWAFWQLFIILLTLYTSQATGDCSVLYDHSVWWGRTKGLVYYHETDHCLSQTANSKKRERLLVVDLYVCPVCFGSKNSEDVLFRLIVIPLEKSVPTWQFPVNQTIKFGPCWEAPYLWLVTYWQLTLLD